MSAQLDLFLPNDEISLHKREIEELKSLIMRSNRSQFSKLSSFGKEIIKLQDELDSLRSLLIREKK